MTKLTVLLIGLLLMANVAGAEEIDTGSPEWFTNNIIWNWGCEGKLYFLIGDGYKYEIKPEKEGNYIMFRIVNEEEINETN